MDPAARYSAAIMACADFGLGRFVQADLAKAHDVTPIELRDFAGGLAESWLRLADVLEHLGTRGWKFAGGVVEPGGLVGEIRKAATSAELYDDIASLPKQLLDWVNGSGLFIVPDSSSRGRGPSFAVHWTPQGRSIVDVPAERRGQAKPT